MTALNYRKSKAYLRDRFVSFDQANVSIASSPVLYGLSVYTVFGATWNPAEKQLYVFRLPEHYQRLVASSRIMDFAPLEQQYSYEQFRDLSFTLLRDNKVREDVLVRATVFIDELVAGTRIHGLKTALSAYVYPLGEILPRTGIHVCVSTWQRVTDSAIPGRAKVNGSYVNNALMKNEALHNGFDDAIAVDQLGHVAEGTVANLFIVRDGVLITPPGANDILEGITRRTIMELAADLGLNCRERSIDRSELYIADELFFSGSSALVTPILSVDRRRIGGGKVGPITGQLAQAFHDVRSGRTPDTHGWLTSVYS